MMLDNIPASACTHHHTPLCHSCALATEETSDDEVQRVHAAIFARLTELRHNTCTAHDSCQSGATLHQQAPHVYELGHAGLQRWITSITSLSGRSSAGPIMMASASITPASSSAPEWSTFPHRYLNSTPLFSSSSGQSCTRRTTHAGQLLCISAMSVSFSKSAQLVVSFSTSAQVTVHVTTFASYVLQLCATAYTASLKWWVFIDLLAYAMSV